MKDFELNESALSLIQAQYENFLRLREVPMEVEYELVSENEDDHE